MNVYQRQQAQILYQVRNMDERERLALASLGLTGELAEVLEAAENVKKVGTRDNLILEIGDFMWYAHLLCLITGDNFKSQVSIAAADTFGFQYTDPLPHLGPLSEMAKKISITKKKTLADFKLDEIATHVNKLLIYVGKYASMFKSLEWYEMVIEKNIEKLEARHGKVPT